LTKKKEHFGFSVHSVYTVKITNNKQPVRLSWLENAFHAHFFRRVILTHKVGQTGNYSDVLPLKAARCDNILSRLVLS